MWDGKANAYNVDTDQQLREAVIVGTIGISIISDAKQGVLTVSN